MSLVVLVGPAGVGKGSLVKQILANHQDFMLSLRGKTRLMVCTITSLVASASRK